MKNSIISCAGNTTVCSRFSRSRSSCWKNLDGNAKANFHLSCCSTTLHLRSRFFGKDSRSNDVIGTRPVDAVHDVASNMKRSALQPRRELNWREFMSSLERIFLASVIVFFSALPIFGQWSPVDSGTTSNLNGAVLLDSGTGFVVGDTGAILKSTDAGATWTPLTSGTSSTLHGVYFLDPNDGVAVGDGGTILRTTDGGTAWQSVTSGVADTLRSVSFNGVNGICGGDSQDILYSTDLGASWQIGQSGFFGGGFPGAQMLSATTGFVAGQNSIFQALVGKTTDGGVSWNFQNFYFDGNEGGANDVFFFDQKTGLVSGSVFDGRGAIARTTDAGMNWSTLFFDQSIEGLAFPTAASGFAVGAGGRILHST